MNRSRLRALRLAAAASTVSVLALAGAPAFASGINYYSGSGDATAFDLKVSPSSILSVNLSNLNSLISSLPGAGAIDALAHSTLNSKADIHVAIDTAHAQGVAQSGTALTSGSALSAPVFVDAASLKTELDTLNNLLLNMPKGTLTVVKSVIGSDPTLSSALNSIVNSADPALNTLFSGIADTLGSPSVNLTKSLSASFGQDLKDSFVNFNQGGILTQDGPIDLSLYEARAVSSDAFADTGTTALKVAPSVIGTLKVPNPSVALQQLVSVLGAAEKTILESVSNSAPAVDPVTTLLSQNLGTVNDTLKGAANQVDLTKLNKVIDAFAALRNVLGQLDGLGLNDILSNNGATARTTLQKTNGVVNATAHSQMVKVDALNINSGPLATVLNTVTSASGQQIGVGTALVTVDGVAGDASVSLDGANTAVTTASGKLVDVKVLGQVVTTDRLLPPGTSCTVSVPGASTCGSIAGLGATSFPDTSALGASVLTITLTRGIFNGDPTATTQHGTAGITALEVAVVLHTEALSALKSAISGATGVTALAGGTVLDARFGVASATASLTQNGATPPVPPKTGNDILPLSILAFALVAAGIGLGVRRMRMERMS